MLECIGGKNYRKVLALGSGGGNDIVSTILLAEALLARDVQVDIGGILSPRFTHIFDEGAEQVINRVSPTSRRYIKGDTLLERPFIDAKLAEVLLATRSRIGKVFGLSLREGTRGLTRAVEQLVLQEGYEALIGFDVGGDILGRPEDRVLSPIMDMATLTLLHRLEKTPSYLVETGLGADGELTVSQIRTVMDQLLGTPNCVLAQEAISADMAAVQSFRTLYNTHIKQIRAGNTGRRLLESLEHTEAGDMAFDYSDEFRIGTDRYERVRVAHMPKAYQGQMFTIDPKVLGNLRPGSIASVDTALQLHIALKTAAPEWGSELDGQIVWSEEKPNSQSTDDHGLLLLTFPVSHTPPIIRETMMRTGIAMLQAGQVSHCLLYPQDEKYVPSGMNKYHHNGWLIASRTDPHVLLYGMGQHL